MSNAPANRPLSPHLSIYKPQITSVLSITHRATGVALFGGLVLFAVWMMMSIYGCHCLNSLIASPAGQAALVLWTMAWFYHLLNGIRHLVWDSGYALEIHTAARAGWAVLIGTVILTVLSWFGSFFFI